MPIKTIVLPIRESDMSEHMLESGMIAAKAYDAHVDVIYVHPQPEAMLPFATLGMTAGVRRQIQSSAEQASRDQAGRLRVLYDAVRERAGVAHAPRGTDVGTVSADWIEVHGIRSVEVANHGRLADLLLIPRPLQATPPPKTFEAMLRDTGRPVLMIPRGVTTPAVTGHAVIGWNGSTEAARAVAACRPVLRGASKVTVLVSTKRERRRPNADDVVTYLKCHSVNAVSELVDMSEGHVGESITAHCERLGADLLVVGSYSRSRLQEMMLGGVTRYLIRAATLPVLMVH